MMKVIGWLGKLLVLALVSAAVWHLKFSPVAVETRKCPRASFAEGVFGTGTLEAKNRVAISPHSTGPIVALHADQGDVIKKGQLLVEFFSDDVVQQLKIAEAELAVTRETVKRLESECAATQARLDLAEADFKRGEELFRKQFKSQSDYEKVVEARKVARAAHEQALVAKREAELSIIRQTAQIAYWKTKLAETKLLAPFDGFVVRRNRELGAVVNPGVSVMDVVDSSEIWASVWVDEARIAVLHPGQPAEVVMRAQPGKKIAGKVRRLARETDRETREHLVDIALDALPENWSLGQRLEATVSVGPKAERLCVPSPFIRWMDGAPSVLVVRNGRIQMQKLQLGIRSGELTEVVAGLTADDVLVCKPDAHAAHVGRRVKSAK